MSAQLYLEQGAIVGFQGSEFVITHILDLDSVLAKNTATGESARLRIAELGAAVSLDAAAAAVKDPELTLITDKDWQEAHRRYRIIYPLLTAAKRTTELTRKAAEEADVHPVTIHRWLKAFERTGKVSGLVPTDKNGGRGQSRLPEEVEAILISTVENEYLSQPNRSAAKTIREIERLCKNAGLPSPHPNTVRNRIADISDERKIAGRKGNRAAREKYAPAVLNFPGADYPLSFVQIDHTELDLIVVDEIDRLPIGRPWITLAIDVYSRMITGFFIALEKPSAMSVGMCLSNSMLPKDSLLSKHGINAAWNCWGIPSTVHADNGKDFRGETLKRAAQEYGIDLVWRPVGRPHFGGHIERLMRTFNDEIHELPGTTFSNPALRGSYDSEKNAAFTLPELEQWLAAYIAGIYHQKYRADLFSSPLKKYEKGLLGDENKMGRGLPAKITDEERLRFDFMPHFERTVQRTYGVEIDNITYYSDVLRPFIGATDPDDPRFGRRFIFRRDPRNIREIYFFHPDFKEYYAVPYKNTAHPPISIWDLRAVYRRLEEEGRKEIDENLIFETYERLRFVEQSAVTETKKVRKQRQQRDYYSRIQHSSKNPESEETVDIPDNDSMDHPIRFHSKIKPFDDLERV